MAMNIAFHFTQVLNKVAIIIIYKVPVVRTSRFIANNLSWSSIQQKSEYMSVIK